MADEEPDPDAPFSIIIEPSQMAGVWANFAQVGHSPYEFTLDFVRLDFGRHQGIVVARVSMSPLFIDQLIEALKTNWDLFAQKALPQEVYSEDQLPTPEGVIEESPSGDSGNDEDQSAADTG